MSLAAVSVRRPVFTTMMIMALVVLGLFSFSKLGVDLFPRVEFPTLVITTTFPGASAEEIETEISKPIEEAVNTIQGIDELRSVSREGVSIVVVSFVLDRNIEEVSEDVRDKVSNVIKLLPDGVDPPLIEKVDPDASPVLAIALSGDKPLREMTEIADKRIKQELEGLAGVGQVQLIGGRERAIQIEVDADRLNSLGLSINQVAGSLRRQNQESPGGRLAQGERELIVRTLGRLTAAEQFGDVVAAQRNGVAIRVRDFATVTDSYEEPRNLARLDGQPGVILQVRKQSGVNTVELIDTLKGRIEQIRAQLPPGLKLDIIRDQSVFIKGSVDAIYEHLVLGGFLASLVVFLFMGNWRASLIAAIAIPTSIIATFLIVEWAGMTLNTMTLLGLTVAVGIVIDDAIVVLENIFRYIEEKKVSAMEAAIEGTKEITLAVMATTLSLLIVFAPVFYLAGIAGRWLRGFALTAAGSIAISMFISFTLTPMLSSRFLKTSTDADGKLKKNSKQFPIYRWIEDKYIIMLAWSLRHRLAVLAVCAITFFSVIPLFMAIGKDFVTWDDQDEFQVNITMPEGTSLEGTDAMLQQIEQRLNTVPHVEHLLTTVNSDGQGTVTDGSIYVKLAPMNERPLDQFQIMDRSRTALKDIAGARISVSNVGAVSSSAFRQTPINLIVRGSDMAELSRISGEILSKMQQIPTLLEVETSLNVGNPEMHIEIAREKAADLDVSVADISDAIRLLVSGTAPITKYKEGDELYEVRLRVKSEQRLNAASLGALMVPTSDGRLVRLDNVAAVTRGLGPAQVERYNRQRQVLLSSNMVTGAPLGASLTEVENAVKAVSLPAGYDYKFIGFGELLQEVMESFLLALVLSVIFMYMVLAAQFESFVHPITILASLPLAIPFALIALFLAGKSLSLFGAIGVLLLFGIVKKNSILQIDFTNRLRREQGMERTAAIMEANRVRLRPILMTTVSIVVAMIPTAFGTGPGSGSRAPIAVVIAGGQTLCFLLTLLAIPVFYTLFDDIAVRFTVPRA
ncbi:MAG: efflux RND transporter permease subunit [Acidobacteria bacterium]|nr:efflux RND transporter permease subunit [Acidobacteriota bacterium]